MSWDKDISDATKQLAALDRVIQGALPRAAQAGAGEFQQEAMRYVPIRSGKLKRSFGNRPGTANEKTAVHSAVHVVYNTAFYAAPVEYGRYKRPYFRPAIESANARILTAMETAVKRESNKVL